MRKPRPLVSFDWALKKLLRNKANFKILEGLLSELLMTDVQVIEILKSDSNKENPIDKFNRVDLKVKNARGEFLLIELQYEYEFDYLQRLIYGISRTITEHLDKNDTYSKVPKVISISILYFDLGQGNDYIYRGTTSFKGLHTHDELILNESQKKLFQRQTVQEIFPELYLIKVNRFDDVARDTLDEWVYFLKNDEIRDNFTAQGLAKAKEILDVLKLPEAERQAYERYQEDLHFQASMVESTWVAGMMEGEEKGRLEGFRDGEKKGRREEAASMLLKLVRRKFGQTPDWVSARVTSADLELIEIWSDNFVFASSVDEVFAS